MSASASSRGQEAAEALRHRRGLGHGFVDVFRVIQDLGIELYRKPIQDALSGAFLRQGGAAFVFVNASDAPNRQRFTAAHELGHALFEESDGEGVFEDDIEGGPDGEGEENANEFASYFLMDELGVRDAVLAHPDSRHRIAIVADRFGVSVRAAAIHLAKLGLVDTDAKRQFFDELDAGLKPSRFLGEFGFYLPPSVEIPPTEANDPRHQHRLLSVYAAGRMSLPALVEELNLSEGDAAALLADQDLAVTDQEFSGDPSGARV